MSALHQQAKDLFLAALARPASERAAFLARACGTDAALRAEVESLLEFHASSNGSGDLADSTRPPAAKVSEPPREVFKPGDIFANRYRMVTRIGRGGMGDVWRVDDLVLDTPVALKLIRTRGGEARERILNEVRLARQITHPAVCRVFDVGTEDTAIFFSMELVHGEDLASLLRRVGRLPAERVLEIARQLCKGLAAAHARGVLHRDLKPANVLVDEDGQVKITDFGIAVLREDGAPHALMGTLGYMAPEQLTPGAPLTERTDIYALGLILYELIVGQHPFNHTQRHGVPVRPASLIPEISAPLDRAIMKALCTEPAERPAGANELLGLIESVVAPRSRATWPVAVAAALALVAGLGWIYMRREAARPLTAQDTIVLADFTNTTGEAVFDGTLKVALAVALEQSPFLKVFPDDRVRETLRLMNRAPDEVITRPIAREIAQREQFKALLSASIAGLGRNYVLALEAVNAQTGDVMAREQVEATSKEEVLTVLGSAVARLREKLGESLASVQKFDVPLARATTPSLAALNAYSLALDRGTVNLRLEAIPHLKRAVELDPSFALALAQTSLVYANNGQSALAADFAKRAFDLRDRVSERERFFISFRYYRDAAQDWARALELTRLWTTTYPRESFAFNSLGTALSRFGEQQQALAPFREAIRLDPRFVAPYSNLATSLIALNRYDDAKAVLQDAVARQLDFVSIRRMLFTTAFIEGDAAGMAANFDATLARRDATAYGWKAHVSAFGGHARRSHAEFREGVQMALQTDLKEVAGQIGVEDAEMHAVVGQCVQAREEIGEALKASRDNFTLERASRALGLCGVQDEAVALTRELIQRYPDATITQRVLVPVSQAALAMARRDAARVLDILEPVRPYERVPRADLFPAFLRGQAYLQLKDSRAAAEFQNVIDHRGEDPDSQLHALASLGLARAFVAAGDQPRAEAAYQKFLADWSSGDTDLAPAVEARLELSRLK